MATKSPDFTAATMIKKAVFAFHLMAVLCVWAASESTPESAPVRESSESTPESAPVRESSESTPCMWCCKAVRSVQISEQLLAVFI